MAEFLQQFRDLLLNYYQHAFPFLLAHAGLTIWVIYFSLWRKFHREISALNKWRHGLPATTEATSVLAQFVSSSEKWGRHGVLIPMTDFSDRLDSVADGMVEELHGRINLFLIIGIAGTFFGLFQFAAEAITELSKSSQTVLLNPFARIFSSALAKAFPVGFVGLVLMLIFHFVASNREHALRGAMANAVRRAIDARDERFVSPIDALTEALKPLQGLDQVLTKSLTPVVERLGVELRTSSDVLAGQFEVLKGSVGVIQGSVQSLEAVATRLRSLMEGAPALLFQLQKLAQEWQQQVASTSDKVAHATASLQSASEELRSAANRMQEIPNEFASATRNQLDKLVEGSRHVWVETSQSFFSGFQETLTGLMKVVQDSSASACSRLENAAGELQTVANTVKYSIESSTAAAIKGAVDEVRKALADVDEALRLKFADAIRNLGESATAATGLVAAMVDASNGANAVAAGIANVATGLGTINEELCDYITQLRNVNPAQNSSSEMVKNIAAKLGTATEQLVSISGNLQQVNRTVSESLHNEVSEIASKIRRRPRKTWDWMMYGRNAE